jgi:hypothetical protein
VDQLSAHRSKELNPLAQDHTFADQALQTRRVERGRIGATPQYVDLDLIGAKLLYERIILVERYNWSEGLPVQVMDDIHEGTVGAADRAVLGQFDEEHAPRLPDG